jgi:hypothetical protein
MINLIPKEEKKRMTVNFYYRLAILFLMLGSFCVLVALVAILPAYLLSSVRNTAAEKKLEIQKNETLPSTGEQSLAAIKSINGELNLVENAEKNKFSISEKVISDILFKKMPNIKITQILYAKDPVQGKKINVLGTAPSREVLLLFRQALENDPTFQKVDLPISDFAKGSDIQFNLSLIPA